MSDASIEWTDEMWNPVTSCSEGARCHPGRLDRPLRWRKRRRVVVSDVFRDGVPDDFLLRVFDIMRQTQGRHLFRILTEHPERMRDVCARLRFDGCADGGAGRIWLTSKPCVDGYDGYRLMGGGGATGMPWVECQSR